ncbi:hypothetical protein HYE67_005350 [Fusarium culmorum]|uniref:Uncharacterized protein n=1 Tax=Fusarium culmorum TaxID=5516 RepID=A0A7S8D6W3_FUSCU|nr:hypothetical protein HYE67_005350 [Fusarium culmorum]
MAQTPSLLPNAVQNAPDDSCRAPITTDALQAMPKNSITSPRTTTIEDPMGSTKLTINVTGIDDMSTNNMSISDMSTNVELIRDRVTQHLAQHPHMDIHKVHAEYMATVERIQTLQSLQEINNREIENYSPEIGDIYSRRKLRVTQAKLRVNLKAEKERSRVLSEKIVTEKKLRSILTASREIWNALVRNENESVRW